jgi:hypothetical protein
VTIYSIKLQNGIVVSATGDAGMVQALIIDRGAGIEPTIVLSGTCIDVTEISKLQYSHPHLNIYISEVSE